MENDELRQQVLDKMTKTCPCRVVTRARIKEAIKGGAHTVEAVAKETGATTGSCKGCRRCNYRRLGIYGTGRRSRKAEGCFQWLSD